MRQHVGSVRANQVDRSSEKPLRPVRYIRVTAIDWTSSNLETQPDCALPSRPVSISKILHRA